MSFGVQPAGINQVFNSANYNDMRLKFSHDCRCPEACMNDLKIFRPDAGWTDVQLMSMCRQPFSIHIINSAEQIVNTSAIVSLFLMDHQLVEDIQDPSNISELERALVPHWTCNMCSRNQNLHDRKQSCGLPQCTGGAPFFAMADGQGTPKVTMQISIQGGSVELKNLCLVKCGESTKKVQLIARKMCLVALLQRESGSPLIWATSQSFRVASNRSKGAKDKQVLELVDRKIGKRQRRRHNNKNQHTPTQVFPSLNVPMKRSTIMGQKNHPHQNKNWQQALEEAMTSQLEQSNNIKTTFGSYSNNHNMQSDMHNTQGDVYNTIFDTQSQKQFDQKLKIDQFNNCYNGYNLQNNINNMSQQYKKHLKQCQQRTTPAPTPIISSNCSSDNFDRNNENYLQREVNIVIHQNLKQNQNYEQVQNIGYKNIFDGNAKQINKFTDENQLQKYQLQTQDFSKYAQKSRGKNLHNINYYCKRSYQQWKQLSNGKKQFKNFGLKKLQQQAKHHRFQNLHPSLVNFEDDIKNQAWEQFAKWEGDVRYMYKMQPPVVTSGDPAQAENFMAMRMSNQGQQPLKQPQQQMYRQQVPRSYQEQATTNIFDKSAQYIPNKMPQTQYLDNYNSLVQPKNNILINGSKQQFSVYFPQKQSQNNSCMDPTYHQSNQYVNLQSTQRTQSQPSPLPNYNSPKMIKIEGTVISQRILNTQPLRAHSFDYHDMENNDEKIEKQGLPRLEQCLQKRQEFLYQQRLQKHSNLNNGQYQSSLMENSQKQMRCQEVSDEFMRCVEVQDEVFFKWQNMKKDIEDVNMLFSSIELKDGNKILESLKNQKNLRSDLDFSFPELDLGDFQNV